MTKSMIRTAVAASLGGFLLTGCVTGNELMEVRQIAEQARADAAAAQATAEEARSVAQQSMEMSRATDERVNRMFQRSMMK